MRDKQVRFPFDVYKADRTTFVPKDTWVSIPVGQLQTTFYLPVWVDEAITTCYSERLPRTARLPSRPK